MRTISKLSLRIELGTQSPLHLRHLILVEIGSRIRLGSVRITAIEVKNRLSLFAII